MRLAELYGIQLAALINFFCEQFVRDRRGHAQPRCCTPPCAKGHELRQSWCYLCGFTDAPLLYDAPNSHAQFTRVVRVRSSHRETIPHYFIAPALRQSNARFTARTTNAVGKRRFIPRFPTVSHKFPRTTTTKPSPEFFPLRPPDTDSPL